MIIADLVEKIRTDTMMPRAKTRMVRVTCPATVKLRDGSMKPCNAFLFEAAPDYQAYIVDKCRKCQSFIEVADIHHPVVLSDYHSPNVQTFYLKH